MKVNMQVSYTSLMIDMMISYTDSEIETCRNSFKDENKRYEFDDILH